MGRLTCGKCPAWTRIDPYHKASDGKLYGRCEVLASSMRGWRAEAYFKHQRAEDALVDEHLREAIRHWHQVERATERGGGYLDLDGLRRIVRTLPLARVKHAMEIAHRSSRSNYYKYFCGICHNWIRQERERGGYDG